MLAAPNARVDSGVKHIEEIREAGLEMPSVNQIEVRDRLSFLIPVSTVFHFFPFISLGDSSLIIIRLHALVPALHYSSFTC
jgi:hypothetical protein